MDILAESNHLSSATPTFSKGKPRPHGLATMYWVELMAVLVFYKSVSWVAIIIILAKKHNPLNLCSGFNMLK